MKTKIESCQDFINVIINCESHPMLTTPRELFITVQSSFDSVITGEFVFETNQRTFSKKCELGDDNDLETTEDDGTDYTAEEDSDTTAEDNDLDAAVEDNGDEDPATDYTAEDDNAEGERVGGFGSTNK